MDIVAHTLWAGAAVAIAGRRFAIDRCSAALTVTAALPDLLQLLPLVAWVLFGDGSWSPLVSHAIAKPGEEPAVPPLVQLLSHHLHYVAHSAVAVAVVSAVAWTVTGKFLVLAGGRTS